MSNYSVAEIRFSITFRRISQRAGTLLQGWRVRLHQNKIHIVSSLFSEKKYEPMWI